MHFLQDIPRFVFLTGKGGVGKTSLACALALKLADEGKRTLLVSTDPASNIGQVFSQLIGNNITPINGVDRLDALEIDPEAAASNYRERLLAPLRDKLPADELRSATEQLSGACTTEIAAFDEFTALLVDEDLQREYKHIVFDTAPTGHTIRLLQLPGAWSGFLEDGRGDASCLGPLAGLEQQRERYRHAVEALSDPQQTRLVLVARADNASLREVARTRHELHETGISGQHLVVNGLMPEQEALVDGLAAKIRQREQAALAALPPGLEGLQLDQVELKAANMLGAGNLRSLLAASAAINQIHAGAVAQETPELPGIQSLVEEIAAAGHGLVMLMGKGGVGKTTMAAAIAVELAIRGLPVHLTTTDPAAHIEETVTQLPGNMKMSRIDPHAETENYRQRVLATKGKGLDSDALAMLEEDLRSPCTEEVAVFQAFARVIREAGRSFVVMDTAPTGHTLLLLDATGAYHREVTRQMGGSGMQVTTPMMQLQDPGRTRILIVTLAETTPVLEAEALQADLRRAGIEPAAWIVNRSLAAADTQSSLLRRRAAAELAEIERVAQLSGGRFAIVPLQAEDPVGSERLARLVHGTQAATIG
ncbi:arsenical pump-driving ATPase [bacterium]|nr:arsenical pump-driving ATPase [bacterium]